MNEVSNVTEKNDSYTLSLPRDELAGIIVDFLGKKEAFSYSKEGYFKICLHKMRQYWLLINEKISKEHNTYLDFFELTVSYDDGTVRKLTGIDQFESYFEQRMVYPISIVMQWNLVLKFPQSNTIETQKIQLSFDTKGNKDLGEANLNIEYTNMAWGLEVVSLLKNQIDKDVYTLSKSDCYYRDLSKKPIFDFEKLTTPLMISVLIACFIVLITLNKRNLDEFSLEKSYSEIVSSFELLPGKILENKNYQSNTPLVLLRPDLEKIKFISQDSVEHEIRLLDKMSNKITELEKVHDAYDLKIVEYLLDEDNSNYSPFNLFYYNQQFGFISDEKKSFYLGKIIKNDEVNSYLQKSRELEKQIVNLQGFYSDHLSKRLDEYSRRSWGSIKSSLFALLFLVLLYLSFFILRVVYSKEYVKYFRRGSYIIITDKANHEYDTFVKNKSKLEFYSVKSVVITVLLGLITSTIYSFTTLLLSN